MTAGGGREAVHLEPAWRDRANFVIAVALSGESAVKTEQLWARQLDDRQFEICCIPFFACDLSMGDVVETDDSFIVRRVVEGSGRFVFRVWFGESFHPRDKIAEGLKALGSLIEWSSRNLLAVDAVDQEQAQLVADFLASHEEAGQLVYETGRR